MEPRRLLLVKKVAKKAKTVKMVREERMEKMAKKKRRKSENCNFITHTKSKLFKFSTVL